MRCLEVQLADSSLSPVLDSVIVTKLIAKMKLERDNALKKVTEEYTEKANVLKGDKQG